MEQTGRLAQFLGFLGPTIRPPGQAGGYRKEGPLGISAAFWPLEPGLGVQGLRVLGFAYFV